MSVRERLRLARFFVLSVLVAAAFAVAPSRALDNVEGLSVELGDTYDQVKEAYPTPLEAEPLQASPLLQALGGDLTSLHLKTKGLWFFFDPSSKLVLIWLHRPFAGSVAGLRIGDSASKMMKVLGKPVKAAVPVSNSQPRSYTYYLDDVTTANFQSDNDSDVIEVIVLAK